MKEETLSLSRGMAKLMASTSSNLKVTSPRTLPVRSQMGPPELPGLTAASIW